MENQSRSEKKTQSKETVKVFVRLGVCFYLGTIIVIFVSAAPHLDALSTISFIIGVQFLFSPFLLLIAFFAYFIHISKLAKIPKDTTLYECITSPTLQYGPIKMIIPVIIEELIDDQIESCESQIE